MHLNKNYFIKQSFEEAADHQSYYRERTQKENKEALFFMMQAAFGFIGKPWPKMDKTHFKKRKRA